MAESVSRIAIPPRMVFIHGGIEDPGGTGARAQNLDAQINLCELKYTSEPFRLTRATARDLRQKVEIFQEITRTRKQIVLTLVTPFGLQDNVWSSDLVDRVVTADALLR